MAFDGITVSCLTHELNHKLMNGRVFKIAQPEQDELLLTIKQNKEQYRLLISANASLPLMYLTDVNKPSPLTAPSFCMLLRKHISNGRITGIRQPGLERIIHVEIEHFNEMGDLCTKILVVELMGKHSNIIFCDDQGKIIDSIKHINAQMSSVREVLPGRDYFIPHSGEKLNPLEMDFTSFREKLTAKPTALSKAIYTSLTGISPVVSESILNDGGFDSSLPPSELTEDALFHLYSGICHYMEDIHHAAFSPVIYYHENGEPVDYAALPLSIYQNEKAVSYPDMSTVLERYYAEKNAITRIRQRSADLRQIVGSALAKSVKKYELQSKQMADTEKKEKYRIYGELITTYGYTLTPEDRELHCLNYYDGQEVSIPIDPTLSPIDNAKKYFDKYSKMKRTAAALMDILAETKRETEHLESISTSLELAATEDDLKEIREEMIQYGYIKRKSSDRKAKFVSRPIHLSLKDGYEIYIGKNNYQNEEISFKIATGNDWWFHAKGIPGSHVVVKAIKNDGSLLPDELYEIAGSLAAYYSKGRNNEKVEVDYTLKKNLKRVAGAAPGFVIYHTNYSLMCTPKSEKELLCQEN